MQETQVQSLGWKDPLKEGMAPHSSILAWRISWTEEPGGLHSMELRKRQTLLSMQATFTQVITGAPKMATWGRQTISDAYKLKIFFPP